MNKKISKKKAFSIIAGYSVILLVIWFGAQQYLILNNPQLAAIEKYKDELKKAPNNSQLHKDLAYEYIQLFEQTNDEGYIKKAKTQFEEILKIDPLDVQANFELALYYKNKINYPKAISLFEKCLKREPTAADVYFELGMIYEMKKNREKAFQMYGMTQKYDPMFEGIDKKVKTLSKPKED